MSADAETGAGRWPFEGPAAAGAGLRPADPARWLLIDEAYEAEMALRDRLIGERPADTTARIAGAEAAEAALSEMIAAALAARPGFLRQNGAVRRPDGVTVMETGRIGAAGRLTQEDWALIGVGGAGAPALIAAVICFPSRWRLSEKIGRPLDAVHAGVPGYGGPLSVRVDRIFQALREGVVLERANWMIHGAPDLHQPHAAPDDGGLYVRSERQTVRRLPGVAAAAFGIKTRVARLDDLDATARAALGRAVAALSPAEIAYRGAATARARAALC